VNFGQDLPWYPPPVGFNYIGHVPPQDRVAGTKPPETKQECEVSYYLCPELSFVRKV